MFNKSFIVTLPRCCVVLIMTTLFELYEYSKETRLVTLATAEGFVTDL